MKVSLNWLKDYVDLQGISAEEVIEKLTISGLEVEDVEYKGKLYENFVVGYVKERQKHPNADKLSLCVVSTGSEEFNVVCGAPNVAAGQKIVFAKVGAVVPDGGFTITKAKIRGEVSMGMICSEKELGLSDNHEGIMVLDPEMKEGTPVAEALGLDDVIIEIGITPNRPDALSHIGVARDLAAIFKRPLAKPALNLCEADTLVTDEAKVIIENPDACPRYSARVVKNVEVKESPAWLKSRLRSIGLRPINNIVDITNYILHETGQPLHAFDLDRLAEKTIVVRNAEEKEKFVTLDSKERTMSSADLMICDAERAVAVAGVMGGENSEVTAETKNVLIESAYFAPSVIRKTSRKLQLSTDASYRFERGTDPDNTVYTAARAAQLMAELGGGSVMKGAIDVYPKPIRQAETSVRYSRIRRILGYEVSPSDVREILQYLGMEITAEKPDMLQVRVPAFRPDIEREIDLIEEVARIYGYDNIPAISKINVTLEEKTDNQAFKDKLRSAGHALGFNEIISNSLLPEELAALAGKPVSVLNPQSSDMASLRTSLLQGALLAVQKNLYVGEKNLALFEIGDIFNKVSEADIKSFDDFSEDQMMMMLLTGKAQQTSWYGKERPYDIYDLKGLADGLISKIYLDNVFADSYYLSGNFNFEYYFAKCYKGKEIIAGGLVKKELLKKFDIQQDVFYLEFNISELENIRIPQKRFRELLKYPKVIRDCAFVLERSVPAGEVVEAIYKSTKKGLLKKVEVFDTFVSQNLGGNKKSLAFSLEYYDESKTLKDDEVEKDFFRTIEIVRNQFNAEFRGNN
ncbi:MAG: phenylalanine--tRNA ligase subunit beta [Bacteroidota bacterium]